MRKLIFITVIGLIFTIKLEAKKIEGQIFYKDDSINVIMKIPILFYTRVPNYEKLQYKVKYFDATGVKKILRPDDAEEIRFTYENEKVRMLSRKKTKGLNKPFSVGANFFLRIEVDGGLKLFSFYYVKRSMGKQGRPSTSVRIRKYILQKGNEQIREINNWTFRKDMIEYFNDCPELSKKIEDEEFRLRDIDSIVSYYNKNCN